jgi:tetratricopeptide (TPR) repeat protein
MSPSDHQTGSFVGSVSDLSVEQALLLDEACTAFEAKWRSGGRPDILAVLMELPEALHPVARWELVQLDVYYRRKSGTPATAEDYLTRFPQLDPAELAALLARDSSSRTRSNGRAEPLSTVPYESFGNYELFEELGRGAMGLVYRARDKRLNRVVAVKFLQHRYSAGSSAARRFLDEATITGQLQHPGIPPVHEVGELPDGRPFIAMKLIGGRTLAEFLGDGSMTRGALVAAFEQICQAVAYAHARGVIHRDLKPGNVMVGAFGEVQVMDWGLAKVRAGAGTDTAEAPAADTFHDPRSGADEHARTRTGCPLGTPAYMAPEQALGAIDQIDERSDVFGLGGILCAILTGQPPFVAPTLESALQLSAQKELGDTLARLDACGADRELVAICKGCLAAEREDRPSSAGAVADALQSYRVAAEERARRAELDRVKAEGERAKAELQVAEQRKRRKVELALLAAVLLLVTGGGAVAWWRQTENLRQQFAEERQAGERLARLASNGEGAAASVGECERALVAGRMDRAAPALADADRRMAEGGAEELRERVERCRADLAILRALNRVDTFRWTPVENNLPKQRKLVEQLRAAFEKFGVVPGVTPADEVARRVADSHVRDRLLTALYLWLVWDPSPGLRQLLALIDPDGFRESFRDAAAAGDRARLASLTGRKEALNQPPWFAAVLGQNPDASVDRRREVLEVAARARPSDLVLLMELGKVDLINQREGAERRLQWYQAAVAAHPECAAAHLNLGVALRDKGDVDGAIASYKAALRLEPTFALAYNNLGNALRDKGELDKAIVSYKAALRIEPTFALAHYSLGNALREVGNVDGAIACYREALRLEPTFAIAYDNLGIALSAAGNVDGAIGSFKAALRIDPKHARAHYNLGVALGDKRDVDGAIACYREAIRLDPKLAPAHYNLGVVLWSKGDVDGAIDCYREAIRLDPTDARAYGNLGVELGDKGDVDGALVCFKAALRIDPKNAGAYHNLGLILTSKGDVDGAIACYREVIHLRPKNADAHNNLGVALRDKGELDKAIASFEDALRIAQNPRSQAMLNRVLRWRVLLPRLPDVIAGRDRPATPGLACEFGYLCGQPFQKRYAAGVRLYASAFAADPKLVQFFQYDAARQAILASAGKDADFVAFGIDEWGELTDRARTWLRADLRRWAELARNPQARLAARQNLGSWKWAPDLAPVRDPAWLAAMAPVDRKAWEAFWADVDAALAALAPAAADRGPVKP